MKKILLLGFGISNQAVYQFIKQQRDEVIVSDQKVLEIPEYHVLDDSLLSMDFKIIIKSPGIDPRSLLIMKLAQKAEMVSDLEFILRYRDQFEVLAITGTNGKTTTTSLLTHLCSNYDVPVYSAGNIGVPIAEIAMKHTDRIRLSLECSSFQLEHNRTLKPKVAAILNLAADHLNRYDTLEDYYNAKFNLLNVMDHNDVFLRNIDDVIIVAKSKKYTNVQMIDYSLTQPADIYRQEGVVYFRDIKLFEEKDVPIPGIHNLQNTMVAVMMAYLSGVDLNHIQKQLKSFKAVEHRLEFIKEINGVRYFNDSKATNPDATKVAINSFHDPIILLAGGYDKKTGFDELVPVIDKVKTLIVFGQTKLEIAQLRSDTIIVDTLDQALSKANQLAIPGDIVLLSPACASFDQFNSFEHRGEVFKELVQLL